MNSPSGMSLTTDGAVRPVTARIWDAIEQSATPERCARGRAVPVGGPPIALRTGISVPLARARVFNRSWFERRSQRYTSTGSS